MWLSGAGMHQTVCLVGVFFWGKCLLHSSVVEKQSSVKLFVSQQNRFLKKSLAVKLAVKHEHLMLTEHSMSLFQWLRSAFHSE